MLPATQIPQFAPHPWLTNPHAMTLAALLPHRVLGLRAPVSPPRGEPREFAVDAESRVLAWCHWQMGRRTAPTIVLVHGLTGDANSGSLLGMAAKAVRAGFNVVRMNARNCGGSERLTPTLYCTAQSGDVLALARELAERDGHQSIHLAGYSMGGNMILKLAGELGADAPPWLTSISAVSPPVDLHAGQRLLDELPSNRVYRQFFLRNMRALWLRKRRAHPGRYPELPVKRIATLLEWDELVTGPHFGFGGAREYYTAASSLLLLSRIRVPTRIVHARDDPFVPFEPLSKPEIFGDAPIELLSPDNGGHCGFIAGRAGTDLDRFWAENRVVDFAVATEQMRARVAS